MVICLWVGKIDCAHTKHNAVQALDRVDGSAINGKRNLYNAWGVAMDTFKVDGTDFGIGNVICEIEDGVIATLKITGNKEVTKSLSADEKSAWHFMIEPPSVILYKIPFAQEHIEIEITDDEIDEYGISFYMLEHHDIYGILTITKECIMVHGEVRQQMSDERLYSLEVVAKR